MPADHKVSVSWQIVFTFLPIVNFWAFYRIRKLRKYVLYVIVPEIVLSIAIVAYYYSDADYSKWGDDGLAFGQSDSVVPSLANESDWYIIKRDVTLGTIAPSFVYSSIIGNAVGWGLQGFAIYLVIIWSRAHNRKFDATTTNTEPAN